MPMMPSEPWASAMLLLAPCAASRSSAASSLPTNLLCSRQVKANATTASVSAGTARCHPGVTHPAGRHRPCPWALTHGVASVPEFSVVLGREEPPDHLLPQPLVVHAQRQHAQPVLVVTGDGVAVPPGAWGQRVVSPGPAGASRLHVWVPGGRSPHRDTLTCPVLLQVVLEPRHQRAMGTGRGTGGPQPQQVQRQPPRVRAPARHPSPPRTPPEVSPALRGPRDTPTYVLCSASHREWPWACRLLRGQGVSVGDRGGPEGPRGIPGDPPAVGVLEGIVQALQVALLQVRVVLTGQAQRQVHGRVGVPGGVPRQPQQPRTQSPHGAHRVP